MKPSTTQRTGYFLVVFQVINFVWMAFYPGLLMAATESPTTTSVVTGTPYKIINGKLVLLDNTDQRQRALNQGQSFGASSINNFTLPTINEEDAPVGYDTVTGEYDADNSEQYTDETQNHLKNEVYLQQMFSGYDKQTVADYVESLSGVVNDPTLISDKVAQIKQSHVDTDETTYTNCKNLEGEDYRNCLMYLTSSFIEAGEENEGRDHFAGENDPIMQASQALIDGEHPFFDELLSGECKELTKITNPEETYSLTETRVCVRQGEPLDMHCKATRNVVTTPVASKVLIELKKPEPSVVITALTGMALDFESCDGDGQTFDSTVGTKILDTNCLLIDFHSALDTSNGSCPDGSAGVNLLLEAGIEVETFEVIQTGVYGYASTNFGINAVSKDFNHGITPKKSNECEIFEPVYEAETFTGTEIGQVKSESTLHVNFASQTMLTKPGVMQVKVVFKKEPEPEGAVVYEDIIASRFLGNTEDYPKKENTWLFGEEKILHYDVFEVNDFPVDEYLPTNLRLEVQGYTNYYQYSEKKAFCNKEFFEGSSGSVNVLGSLYGDGLKGYQCHYEVACSADEAKGNWIEDGGLCTFIRDLEVTCPQGFSPSSVYSNKCVKTSGSPEMCSTTALADYACNTQIHGGTNISGVREGDLCRYNTTAVVGLCEAGWQHDLNDSTRCIKTTQISNMCPDGSYPSESNPSQCYTTESASCPVQIPFNFEFDIFSYGRATNLWDYQVKFKSNREFPFVVMGDMHQVITDEFIPEDSTPDCQIVIDNYVENKFVSEARCLDDLGTRFGQGGIEFNNHSTKGLVDTLKPWGTDVGEPLLPSCWNAELILKTKDEEQIGIKPENCIGLNEYDYNNCINGEYCTYDDLNGQEVCYPLGSADNGSLLGNSCKALEDNPACTEVVSELRCEEYGTDSDGTEVCLYQSAVFECKAEDSEYALPGKEEGEIVCGGSVDCIGGTCSSITEEKNEDFGEAAVMAQVAEEIKKSADCAADPTNCKVFSGKSNTCSQPQMWGSQDCCDPDGLGMGGMDVIATLKAMKYIYDLGENEIFMGYVGQAWSGVSGVMTEIGAGEIAEMAETGVEMVTSVMTSAADAGDTAYNAIAEPISNAFNSALKEFGFSSETVPDIVASTTASASAAAQQSIFSGLSQYIANGVYAFIDFFLPNVAEQLFTSVIVEETGERVVTGLANEGASEALGAILAWVGVIMLIYSIYNLVIGFAFGCKQNDYETTQKIKLLSTHYSHSFCDKKSILGCMAYKQVHCLYESPFTRIISEQIRMQEAKKLGVDYDEIWKDLTFANQANCKGFTIAELGEVDWDEVDLSEYFEIMMAGYFENDPANLPESFVPTNKGAGGRNGPEQGKSNVQSNIDSINIIAADVDMARRSLKNESMIMTNPMYMPWYKQPKISPDSTGFHCRQTCSADFVYSSEVSLCVKNTNTEVAGQVSCKTGFNYDAIEKMCIKKVLSPVLPGCQDGYTLSEVDNLCHRPDVVTVDASMSCPEGSNYQAASNKCEQYDTIPGQFSCASHGAEFVLINTCPLGSSFNDGTGKCSGEGIEESPIRKCIDSATSQVSPLLSCPVTESVAPDLTGNCLSEYTYNASIDMCEKSRYTLEDNICTLVVNKFYEKSCPDGELYDDVTDKCILTSIASYPATITCPDGFVMQGESCFKTDTVNATPTCDVANGFAKVGDHCEKADVSVSPVTAYCPEGFRLSDDRTICVKAVLTQPLPPICPDDFTLTGSVCTKTTVEQIPASQVCVQGFTYNITTDLCERLSQYTPILTCDEVGGYKLNEVTGQCEKTTTDRIDAIQTCTSPSVLGTGEYENYCHRVVISDAEYSCKTGFTYDEVNMVCTIQETIVTVAEANCPAGYVNAAGECIKVTQVPANKSCPENSVFNAVKNVCEELTTFVADLVPYCESPRVYENGQCVEKFFTFVEGVCPDPSFSYNSQTKTCAKLVTQTVPPIELCGSGDEKQEAGNCTSGYSIPAVADCGVGYFYDVLDDICIQEQGEIIPGTPQCLDDGFVYDGNLKLCVKEITVNGGDCPTGFTWNVALTICLKQESRLPTFACPALYAFDGINCSRAEHEALACPADTVYDAVLKMCIKDEGVAATLACKTGYTFDGSICVSDVTQPPICSNSLVYNITTKVCETTGTKDVITTCPVGFNDNSGNCVKITQTDVQCNAGFSVDLASNTCKKLVSEAPQTYCFKGSDTGTNCQIDESVMPICDVDFTYNSLTKSCLKQSEITGSLYCPEVLGYQSLVTPEQRCAYFETKLLDENGDCPNGFALDNGQCLKFSEYKPPYYSCPEGFIQQSVDDRSADESSICLMVEAASPLCDLGFNYDNGYCVKSYFTDYDLACASGLVLEGGMCVANDTHAVICPAGALYSSEIGKCLAITQVSYILSCPEFYNVSGLNCVSAYTQIPECNGGFGFNTTSGLCEENTTAPQCIAGYVYDSSLDTCKKNEQLNANGYCDVDKFDTGTGCVAYSAATCLTSGYTLNTDSDNCEKLEVKAEEDLCASDEIDTGTGCMKVEAALCPANHALNPVTDRCEYTVVVTADYTCAAGEVDTGTGCKQVEPPGCPIGYSFVAVNDRCEKFESKNANAYCEALWLDVGNGCKKFTAPICTDSNYSPASKQCVKNLSYDMTYHCGVGDVDTGTGCRAAKQPICSLGFTYYSDRDQCEQSQSVPAEEACPISSFDNGSGCIAYMDATCAPGGTFNYGTGKCLSTATTPATGVCSIGMDTGSSCQVTETKLPPCPTTYTYSNTTNKCEKTLTTPADGQCSSGTDTGVGCAVLEQKAPPCPATYAYNSSSNRCEKTLSTPADGQCSSGTDTGVGCAVLEQKAPPCPATYAYNSSSNRCEKTLTTPADGTCSTGSDTGTQCSEQQIKAVPCPVGYTYNTSTNQCQKTESQAATLYCNNGYYNTGSGCKLIGVKSCAKGTMTNQGCRFINQGGEIDYVDPKCDSGFTLYSANFSQTCLKNIQEAYKLKCDSGWSLSGTTCSRTLTLAPNCGIGWTLNTALDKCTRAITSPYDGYECDSGWSLSGTTCSKLVWVVVDCGAGWTLNTSSDKCERTVNSGYSSYTCDSGWTLSGTTCYKLVFTQVDCGAGWTLNTSSDKCERTVNSGYSSYTCDSGWTRSGSTCSKLVQVVPDCGAGWVHNMSSDLCEKVTVSPYDAYQCAAGWSLSGTSCSRVVQDEPLCETGYLFHETNKRCEAPQQDYSYSCLNGWSLNGSSCEGTAVEGALCDSGYILDVVVDRCVSNNLEAYLTNCAVGYAPNHATMKCEKYNYSTPVCSPGSLNQATDTCESAVKPYLFSCELPWSTNGPNCERTLTSVVECSATFTYQNVSKVCETIVNAYDRTCESGFTLNGVQCEKLNVAAPICPDTYTYDSNNNQCQTVSAPHGYICGTLDWTHTGSACERLLTESPYCEVGLDYEGSNNQCQGMQIPYNYGCPVATPPWSVVGDKCERTLLDAASCNVGESLIDDQCIFVENNAKVFQCIDSSYKLSGEACEKFIQIAVDCAGGDYLAITNDCVKPQNNLITNQCGDGWTLFEGQCKKSSMLPQVVDCEVGFTSISASGQCARTDYETPSFVCPTSHPIMTEAKVCEKVTVLQLPVISYECANAGHTLNGNQCLVEGGTTLCENPTHELIDIALAGFPEELVCRYQEMITQPPTYSCPDGFTLEKAGLCVKQEKSVALLNCPANFLLDTITGQCILTKEVAVPFDLSCDPTFVLSGTLCIKVETAELVFSCQNIGQILVGAFCYNEETVTEPPTKICINENTEGKCEQDVYTNPDYSCPLEYSLAPYGNQCIKDTVDVGADPLTVCIDGYTYELGACSKLETQLAVIACPDVSWALNSSVCDRTLIETINAIGCDTNAILFDNRCYLKETSEIIVGCSNGFTFDTINNTCTRDITRVEPIIYTCLSGYYVVGEMCVSEDVVLVTIECLEVEHKLIGKLCYEQSQEMGDPINTCAIGFIDTGVDCTKTNEFPAQLACSDSSYIYNPSDNTCSKTVEEIKSPVMECATGYTQISPLLCQITLISVDPTITCPTGWSQGSGRCEQATEIVIEQGFCDSGFEKIAGECVKYFTELPTVTCTAPAEKKLSKCFVTAQETELAVEVCDN
jgi:hypothetical protein